MNSLHIAGIDGHAMIAIGIMVMILRSLWWSKDEAG